MNRSTANVTRNGLAHRLRTRGVRATSAKIALGVAVAAVAAQGLSPASAVTTPTNLGKLGLTRTGSVVTSGTADDALAVTTGACPATDGSSNATNYVGISIKAASAASAWQDIPLVTTTTVGVRHDASQTFPLSDTFRNIASANGVPLPVGNFTVTVSCQDLTASHISGQYASTLYFNAASSWTLNATVPGVPARAGATPRNASAVITWLAPRAVAVPISGYHVLAYPGGRTCTTTGALSCTVTGLVNARAYKFYVQAINGVGTSAGTWTSVIVAGTPTAPRSARVVATSRVSVAAWVVPASNSGAAISRYQVRWLPRGSTHWTAWTSTGLVRSARKASIPHGLFQVRALNSRGGGVITQVAF